MNVPAIGILMLNTRFPRPVGDIGNPATWDFPVRYRTVETATVDTVVSDEPLPADVLEAFVIAGQALVEDGVAALTTSCGFLAPYQEELASRLPVPFLASSLMQVAEVQSGLPMGGRVGIITIDSRKLTQRHLTGAGAPADTPVVGLETGSELHRVITGNLPQLDQTAAQADLFAAGEMLRRQVPGLGAVVLECTNLPPYAPALRAQVGLPVYDIVTAVSALYRQQVSRIDFQDVM